ncbi:MAG: serine/threonine protein kinase, partial [Planctomycetes bacterium]|nr:serine/threonine protein kinase [Planctomycetota bacterium]
MTQSNEPREDRLNELIAEYLRRVDRGEEVDPEHFIAPHPELADSFAQYLRDALLADGLKPSHAGPPEQLSATRDTSCSPAADETIPPSDVLVGQEQATEARQFGRYRLVKLLGQGAMGAVYLAEDPELRRHVALKIPKFRDDQDTAARERCQREARAAATISHPNICQVYDIGEQDGTPFIAMAYIEGKSLSQFVGADCQWPERDVAKLVRKIAVALAEAHVKGVVHRDLKPGNIMLDQRQEPIVMDFGLAGGINQPGEEKLTQTGMPLGTPAYMAPEQAEADFARVGPASDVYSLGVICYELLTAQLPFQGPIAAMIVQIARDEPRRPSELRPSLDKRIEAICLKMMAKSPEDRYPTAAELAAALRHFLEETATVGKSASHATAEAVELLEAAPADYRSTEAGKRTATSPEPNRAGPGLPILPIAITAVAFALIVLVIVVLLRDASLVGFGQFTVLEGDNPALEIGLKGPTVAKAADAQPRAAEEETVSVEDVPWLQRPKGAPPPLAIAPFDEAQAKQHQKAWAEYLGVPVETTNSIGMKLVLIPPCEFMMGSHR